MLRRLQPLLKKGFRIRRDDLFAADGEDEEIVEEEEEDQGGLNISAISSRGGIAIRDEDDDYDD